MNKVTNETFFKYSFLTLAIAILLAPSCDEKNRSLDTLSLDRGYSQIKTIESFANCISPYGKYTSEINSYSDGSCSFKQVFENRPEPFSSEISTDGIGYTLNEKGDRMDTLPQDAIEMIRSHQFHKMLTDPSHFYRNIIYRARDSNGWLRFEGVDILDHSVSLYFDEGDQMIKKIELINPVDTTEIIEIINKSWVNSRYGKLVKDLDVIQAQKDTFTFHFVKLKINSENVIEE